MTKHSWAHWALMSLSPTLLAPAPAGDPPRHTIGYQGLWVLQDPKRPPLGSQPQSPAPSPSLTALTSALWKQLLLEGLSISLFLQEINTPHKVNGGFRQGAFTFSLSGLRLCSVPMTDPPAPADSEQARRSQRGRQAWRPAAVCANEPPGAGPRGP